MNEGSDTTFDERMQEVQQQFLCYKEKSSKRFQKLEELVVLAAHTMSMLKEMKAKSRVEGFVHPFGWKTKEEHGNPRSGRTTHESLQKLKLNVPRFEDEPQNAYAICKDFQKSGSSTRNGTLFGALFNEQKWSDIDSEVSITTGEEKAAYDELPGEDKEDWRSEEIICIALGLEDFFEPKQNLEEGNSPGAKVLECISYFGKPSPSVSPAAVSYVPRKVQDEVGSVENWSREHIKLFGVNYLFDCSLETKLFDKSTKRKTVIVGENEIEDESNKPSNLTKEESKEESNVKLWSFGLVTRHGDMPKIAGCYKVEEKQGGNEAASSMITTSMMKIAKAFPKDFLAAAANSYELGLKSNFGNGNMVIFDPGGQVHNKQMIRSKVTLAEDVMMIKVGGQVRQLKEIINLKYLAIDKEHSQLKRRVFMVQIANSIGIQGLDIQEVCDEMDRVVSEINQQYVDLVRFELNAMPFKYNYIVFRQCRSEINKVMRLKYRKASRRNVVIIIFDPGGFLSFYKAQLVDCSAGILNVQPMVTRRSQWKSDAYEKKRNHSREALSVMYLIQAEVSCEGKQEVAMMVSACSHLLEQYARSFCRSFIVRS